MSTVKYDKKHDILHVFLGEQVDAWDDEDIPGIYIRRAVKGGEEIVGLTIMDFSRRLHALVRCAAVAHEVLIHIKDTLWVYNVSDSSSSPAFSSFLSNLIRCAGLAKDVLFYLHKDIKQQGEAERLCEPGENSQSG